MPSEPCKMSRPLGAQSELEPIFAEPPRFLGGSLPPASVRLAGLLVLEGLDGDCESAALLSFRIRAIWLGVETATILSAKRRLLVNKSYRIRRYLAYNAAEAKFVAQLLRDRAPFPGCCQSTKRWRHAVVVDVLRSPALIQLVNDMETLLPMSVELCKGGFESAICQSGCQWIQAPVQSELVVERQCQFSALPVGMLRPPDKLFIDVSTVCENRSTFASAQRLRVRPAASPPAHS